MFIHERKKSLLLTEWHEIPTGGPTSSWARKEEGTVLTAVSYEGRDGYYSKGTQKAVSACHGISRMPHAQSRM